MNQLIVIYDLDQDEQYLVFRAQFAILEIALTGIEVLSGWLMIKKLLYYFHNVCELLIKSSLSQNAKEQLLDCPKKDQFVELAFLNLPSSKHTKAHSILWQS